MPNLTWRSFLVSAVAAGCGLVSWLGWLNLMADIPTWARALVSVIVFVIGPGLLVSEPMTRRADRLDRLVVSLAAGLVATPALAHGLGLLGGLVFVPWLAAAMTGVAAQRAVGRAAPPRADRRALVACALVGALACGAGVVAYSKRLSVDGTTVTINGDYDSYDSTYYAAMSAELATHVPPEAPFEAGHRLNYSFHTQLLLAMVFRFGGVPLLDLYLRLAWPALLTMLALTAFVFIRRAASWPVALLGTTLLVFGSDFSYVAAWFFGDRAYWDNLLWSTNWMTPGAEMLFFNPWTPALCVLFLGLWALLQAEERDDRAGVVWACICFGSLVEFKPFAFATVVGALALTTIVSARAPTSRRRLTMVVCGSVLVGLPYLITIALNYQDSQSVLEPGNGYFSVLPDVVMRQLGFGTVLAPITRALGGEWPALLPRILGANILFVLGGVGLRLIGARTVRRAITGKDHQRTVWRVMAWMIVLGAAAPLAVISRPYHQTFQFFHVGLYLLWLFVARTLIEWTDGHTWRRATAGALVVALAIPSTLHYLDVKWHDDRHPFAAVGADAFRVIDYLRLEDPDHTVLVQHYPDRPSLLSMLAERRTLLGWARYARDSGSLREEIDAFFDSARRGQPEDARSFLTRHHVTDVLETVGGDRIHPDVLRSLHLVVDTPTFRLYTVPDNGASHTNGVPDSFR